MKTIDEIAADIRQQRDRIEQHIREFAELGSAEEILKKLQDLRSRRETTNGPESGEGSEGS